MDFPNKIRYAFLVSLYVIRTILYSLYMEFNFFFLLCVKCIHLIDMTDLFKISNLVVGGEAIVTDLYSSLE
jgi:hypothetical protein